MTAEAQAVLVGYYAELAIVQRDNEATMEQLLADPRSAMWMAFRGGEPAGSVVLRAGVPDAAAAECKRLYVRPPCCGQGAAVALINTLEGFVQAAGFAWVYLDTHENFRASVALYRQRGYEPCARYNTNPQATLFPRKRLAGRAAID